MSGQQNQMEREREIFNNGPQSFSAMSAINKSFPLSEAWLLFLAEPRKVVNNNHETKDSEQFFVQPTCVANFFAISDMTWCLLGGISGDGVGIMVETMTSWLLCRGFKSRLYHFNLWWTNASFSSKLCFFNNGFVVASQLWLYFYFYLRSMNN